MIKNIKFTSNIIDQFVLEVKNIIDNDFMLKYSSIVFSGILLNFDNIFDTGDSSRRIALIKNDSIIAAIPNDIFSSYKYDISYVPYESLYIRFIKK